MSNRKSATVATGKDKPDCAPMTCSASPQRRDHLIKGMRYWLNRAEEKLTRGYVSHGKIAVGKASEALDQLELETLRG